MKITRTAKLKLDISAEQILPTAVAYTEAFNYICEVGWKANTYNPITLHEKTYKNTREKYQLPAQLAISARSKAKEALKAVWALAKKGKKISCPNSTLSSIRYDARSFSVWFEKKQVSLSTLNGRVKAGFSIPKCFDGYLSWTRKSAELLIREGSVFLNIVFEKEIEDIPQNIPDRVIGIDRGINRVAVTSENKFYGKIVKGKIKKQKELRRKLQKCGSKSAKRHLKKLKLKENRYRRDVNHCISKAIINAAPKNSILVLEDLTHMRETAGSKEVHNWSFYQLEEFLRYKAEVKGIQVDYVDARYTSRKCSRCGHTCKENRKSQPQFECVKCGFQLDADLNAARNICNNYVDAKSYPRGLFVNQPIVGPI